MSLFGLFGNRRQLNDNVGGILTGAAIDANIRAGRIKISDYDAKNLNTNSYNIRLGNTVTVYRAVKVIDLHDPKTYDDTETYTIDPNEGVTLRPGTLYLFPTKETFGSDFYEPLITGRSSIGRLGIDVHKEAGFGDIGFHGIWTLQMTVTYPTIVYPNDPLAQVYFLTAHGLIADLYHGKYQGANAVRSSRWRAAGAFQDN